MDVRGIVVVGDGPYDLEPVLAVPAVVHAARTVLDVVGNVTFAGPSPCCARAEELCSVLTLGRGPADAEVVVVHQACRPLAPSTLVAAVVEVVRAGAAAAAPVLALTDTVKKVGRDGTLQGAADRATLRVVQAPFAYRPARLPGTPRDALDLVRLCAAAGAAVHPVLGDPAAAALRSAWDVERVVRCG